MIRNENYVASDKTGTESNPEFINCGGRYLISENILAECRGRENLTKPDQERELYILVARTDGIITHSANPTDWYDGCYALYMNSDGLGFERVFYVIAHEWDEIPHSIYAPEGTGEEGSSGMKKWLKKAVREHKKYKKKNEDYTEIVPRDPLKGIK